MIEENGIVVALAADGHARVRVSRRSACGGCQSGPSCGTGLLGKPSREEAEIEVRLAGFEVRVGDVVTLGVAPSILWRGLVLLYLWPLACLAAGGITGQALAGEAGAAAGSVLGLGAGLWLSGRWSRAQRQDKNLPIVIKKHSA